MTQPTGNPTGRPTKYSPQLCKEVERLSSIGITLNDIAYFLELHPNTVSRWRKRHPAFDEAIKRGDAKKRVSLTNALFKSAIEARNIAAQIFLAKNWLGMSDRQDVSLGVPSDGEASLRLEVVHIKPGDQPGNGKGNGGGGGNGKPKGTAE
jgi:transposase-like protein